MCSQDILKNAVLPLKELLNHSIFKGLVIFLSCAFLAIGILGCINIQVQFEYQQLFPSDSYVHQLIKATDRLYPNDGWYGDIYTGHFNSSELQNIDDLVNLVMSLQKIKFSRNVLKGNSKPQTI